MRKQNPIFLVLFSVVFLGVGIFVLIWGISSSRSALASSRWPSVPGSVTQSAVKSSRSSKGGTTYGADIHYTYTVKDQSYTGSKVTFGDISTSNSNDARQIVNRYPVGRAVNVFYNPANPSEAVLETGFTAGLLLPLGVGTLFTLFGGVMLINSITALLNSRPEADNSGLPSGE